MSDSQAVATPQESLPVSQADGQSFDIIKFAIQNQVPADQLSQLMDLQERNMNKQAEMEFNKAMSDMQEDLPSIREDGAIIVNNQVRSNYAKFEDINKVVKPVLKKHGFAVSFRLDESEKGIKVTGVLMHKGGHREHTSLTLPPDSSGSKNSVQAVGSTVSYGKRYVMNALLNITTGGEDDDATSLSPITADQVMDIAKRACKDYSLQHKILEVGCAQALHEIPASNYQKVDDYLKSLGK